MPEDPQGLNRTVTSSARREIGAQMIENISAHQLRLAAGFVAMIFALCVLGSNFFYQTAAYGPWIGFEAATIDGPLHSVAPEPYVPGGPIDLIGPHREPVFSVSLKMIAGVTIVMIFGLLVWASEKDRSAKKTST